MRDPSLASCQALYFDVVDPFLYGSATKMIDQQYLNIAGHSIPWCEVPVIYPLTPANFLKNFYLIAQRTLAQSFAAASIASRITDCFRRTNIKLFCKRNNFTNSRSF